MSVIEEIRAPVGIDCYRALAPGPSIKDDSRVMYGRFAELETWTEVNSAIEGHFMERTASSAFRKTIRENRDKMRVLFHHGRDALGFQVLGPITELQDDSYHEVELFESVPSLIVEGLRAGQYGSSYRFQLVRHEFIRHPRASDHNPERLPELTVLEAKVREFGPTPFPVYAGSSSALRSVTDDLMLDRLAQNPEQLEQLLRGRSMASLNGLDKTIDTPLADKTRNEDDGFKYRRSVEMVGSAVWAIHPEALATIVGIIGERANGHLPTEQEIKDRIGTRSQSETEASNPGVVAIRGPIVPRASLMSDISGASSVEQIQKDFRAALDDPAVTSIVLDIDSPGGDAQMIPELASEIREARGTKPIVAVANPMAASGAYWIASAADEIIVTPSGEVGSIGAYSAHTDLSAAQEKAGIKTTLVSAGEYKVERNPFMPLSEEAQSEMQGRVDAIHSSFVDAVAQGRGVDSETVLSEYGKGRMLLAPLAVAAGMADRVGTFDQILAEMNTETPDGADRAEPDENAPPDGGAEPDAHSARGRRVPMQTNGRKEASRWLPTERKEGPKWLP